MSPLSPQWRSLEQLADDPDFVARAVQEFPSLAETLASPHDRRRALKLMAAAFAMAGVGGCDWAPEGTLIPAVRAPPNIIPGLPNFYATANVQDGYATGVVVKHQMGRPIKVEGNPRHPASLGATDVFAQAQVLDFYDPDRAWAITAHGSPSDQSSLRTALTAQRAKIAASRGNGFHILSGAITSPTLTLQLDALLARYPEARWHRWQAISRDVANGALLAYGEPVELAPKLDATDVLFAIDSDLLSSAPGHLRFARDFASRRNPYHSYPPEFEVLNVLSSAGATILAMGYLLPLGYLTWSLFYGERASSNPWNATGLEWQTASPPLTENFVSTPIVTEPPYNYPPPEVVRRHV